MIENHEVVEIVKDIIREELRIEIDGSFCGTPKVYIYLGEELISSDYLPNKD